MVLEEQICWLNQRKGSGGLFQRSWLREVSWCHLSNVRISSVIWTKGTRDWMIYWEEALAAMLLRTQHLWSLWPYHPVQKRKLLKCLVPNICFIKKCARTTMGIIYFFLMIGLFIDHCRWLLKVSIMLNIMIVPPWQLWGGRWRCRKYDGVRLKRLKQYEEHKVGGFNYASNMKSGDPHPPNDHASTNSRMMFSCWSCKRRNYVFWSWRRVDSSGWELKGRKIWTWTRWGWKTSVWS